MTTDTQTFISISDIKGIQAECAGCKTRMTVSFDTPEMQVQAQKLAKNFRCPHCGTQWFASGNDPRLTMVGNFVGYLVDMHKAEPDFEKGGVNLRITLELAPSSDKLTQQTLLA